MEALGRHLVIELYKCSGAKLNDVTHIEQSMIRAARDSGATVLNSTFHHFQPFGVSGVVVIQESHLAIHTWPEYGFASLDLFTCGESVDTWMAYHLLKEALEAEYGSATEMWRGSYRLLQEQSTVYSEVAPATPPVVAPHYNRNVWMTERNEDSAFSLRHSGDLLYRKTSAYQDIKVYETFKFGNTLVLDDMIMCTEKDEFVYHEMIAHIPMMTLPNPKRALVIGGGDGGTVRELLRYDSLEEVVLVEIDEFVIDACKQYLPSIAGSLDHPKLKLHVADGIQYVREAADRSFDLIIVDSTDPVGPAEGLFNEAFYQQVHRCLTDDGVLVAQSESPMFNAPVFQSVFQCHQRIFGANNVHCYLAFIPTYPTGMWSFAYASKGSAHPLKSFDADRASQFSKSKGLKYYNEMVHSAAFALPNFVRDLLQA